MKRISKIIEHISLIATKRHLSGKKRWALFYAYLRIVLKRMARNRLPFKLKYHRMKFLGFDVELDNFREDFYWIFTELFVEENYYFESKTNNPTIVDCGSNVGLSILYFKFIYPDAKIIGFEPSPDNLKILNRNIEKNSLTNIKIYDIALGDKPRELEIFTQGPGTTMYEEFAGKQKKLKMSEFGSKVKIKVELLSEYVNENIDFLKLDVEGAEGEILKNLDESQKMKTVDQMAMEYHQFSAETNKLSVIANILEKNGFIFYCASEPHNITESTKNAYKTFMIFAKK